MTDRYGFPYRALALGVRTLLYPGGQKRVVPRFMVLSPARDARRASGLSGRQWVRARKQLQRERRHAVRQEATS